MGKCYIVGGGPSIKGQNLNSLSTQKTIAVNKSVFSLTNPTYFITKDYTIIRKLDARRLKLIPCARFFVVSMFSSYVKSVGGVITDTRANVRYTSIYDCFDTIILSTKEEGIGTTFRDFRAGNNSGYSALQLAIVLGFTNIYLLGIDLTVEKGYTHFHQGYGESYNSFVPKLLEYQATFTRGLQLIERKLPEVSVYSCSPTSALNSIIPYIPLEGTLNL